MTTILQKPELDDMAKALLRAAIETLRFGGISVQAADMPGLYDVAGRGELTYGQLIDLARQFRKQS